jgi:hypothetical protein
MAGRVGIPHNSTGIGRFGVVPPNASAPRGANPASPTDAGVSVPWYASGPVWVLVFLAVGYVLVFQTLKG